jgi:Flp pilus assembly protein TadB
MSSVDVAEVSQEGVGSTDETSAFSSYSKRLISLRSKLSIAQSARSRSLLMMGGCICLATLLIGLVPTHHAPSLLWWAAPLLGACYALRQYIQSGAQWREIEKRCEYFERGMRRLTGTWQGHEPRLTQRSVRDAQA